MEIREAEQTERREEDDGASPAPASDERGGYLGFVAHEVRNPLSTALWTAELLTRMSAAERGGPRGDKLAAMCLRSLARVRQLIEDHFLCERLDAGGLPTRVEAVPVAEAFGALAGKHAESSGVTANIDATLVARADRLLLERGIDAIVGVCAREGTPVEVVATADDSDIHVEARGRAPEGELVDPRKGSPSEPRGRALGIAVARRVASALGGRLAATESGLRLSIPRATDGLADPASTP